MGKPGVEIRSKGLGELKQRLLFLLGAIIIFRIGSFIPVPGVNAALLAQWVQQQQDTVLGMFNVFSGGALSRASIFSLGIMPYITASIIVQMMSHANGKLKELRKEGESGRKKIQQYTRYLTIVIGAVQAIGLAGNLPNLLPGVVPNPDFAFYFVAVVTLLTGTMFLMWLGEQITERGIGNGISMIILVGIVAGLPPALVQLFSQASTGERNILILLAFLVLVLLVTAFVVFVERGQRRIVVNYAKRQQGRKMFAAQSSHLPLKVNMAGVIPAIFASSIILFPGTLASWFGQQEGMAWLQVFSQNFQPGQPLYMMVYAIGIIFFCFFYTALTFNPKDMAENLKKGGAFIPGIRPGQQTAAYLDKVVTRLTLAGALYMTFVCLVPEFLILFAQVPFYFGGTSLLIIVVVVIDFIAQLQSHTMSQQYDTVLKKANLKNVGPAGRVR